MNNVVVDIETVGEDFASLDEISQDYFLKFADTEIKVKDAKNSLSFYPLTAQIIAIGMLETRTQRGVVYFQCEDAQIRKFREGEIDYIPATEQAMLNYFWNQLKRYDQFVSFNGRVFDCPFLMVRSAIQHIRATRNLMPYRYNCHLHIDLADQLSFYDAMRRKFPLHMWCRAFGIESPKNESLSGLQVKEYFQNGRYLEIAKYCMRDVEATKVLYQYWDKYLKL